MFKNVPLTLSIHGFSIASYLLEYFLVSGKFTTRATMHSRVITEVFELCLAEFLGRSFILELQSATKRKLHFIFISYGVKIYIYIYIYIYIKFSNQLLIVQYLKPVPFRIEKTL